jgi:hypothetical protein
LSQLSSTSNRASRSGPVALGPVSRSAPKGPLDIGPYLNTKGEADPTKGNPGGVLGRAITLFQQGHFARRPENLNKNGSPPEWTLPLTIKEIGEAVQRHDAARRLNA